MRTRSKHLLLTLALLAGLFGVLYASAPTILASIAVRVLSRWVEVRNLEIESVDLTEIDVAVIGVNNSQMRLDAQHAAVHYQMWPFRIRSVDVKRARLAITVLASSRGGSGELPVAATVPALPPFPLRIESLDIQAPTPWGQIDVPMSLHSKPAPAGGVEGSVDTPELSAKLDNPAHDRQALTIFDAQGSPLLSLSAALNGQYPIHFDGTVNPENLVNWIHESETIPAVIKSEAAPFDIDGRQIRLDGSLERNMDFNARLTGALGVRDGREASSRLFQRIDLDAPSGYTVKHSGASWSGSGDASFKLALDSQTTFTGRNPGFSWSADEGLTFSAASPRLRQLGLAADALRVAASSLVPNRARGNLSAKGLRTSDWPENLPHYDVGGNWSWNGTSLTVSGDGKAAGLPALSWKLDTAGARGRMEITGNDAAAALSPTLQAYTQSIARELKIKSGELQGRYRFQWDAKGEQTGLTLTAGPVDADLDEMEIRGLEARLANQGNTIDNLTVGLSIPSLKLGAGVLAEHASLKLRLALPEVHIDAASLHLFGGEVSLQPTKINLNDDRFEFLVNIDAMSLEKVMQFFDLESTQLTGAVTGPVRIIYSKAGGLEINEGNLHGIEPGVLKFNMSQDTAAASHINNIALRALQDFQYKELKASLVYKPDGEYRITARIVGDNPNVLNGHPIALNPTIHGRLPALFRAFFISGDFDRAIIETLQKEGSSSTTGETPSFKGD